MDPGWIHMGIIVFPGRGDLNPCTLSSGIHMYVQVKLLNINRTKNYNNFSDYRVKSALLNAPTFIRIRIVDIKLLIY